MTYHNILGEFHAAVHAMMCAYAVADRVAAVPVLLVATCSMSTH